MLHTVQVLIALRGMASVVLLAHTFNVAEPYQYHDVRRIDTNWSGKSVQKLLIRMSIKCYCYYKQAYNKQREQ